MSTTTTTETLTEFGQALGSMNALGEALGLPPCEALAGFFPAICDDEEVLSALAVMMDPAVTDVGHVVAAGLVDRDTAEHFLHNVFHLLQVSAALGHMLGVSQALGSVEDIPGDLSDVVWSDLPDVFGEDVRPEDN